MTLFVKWLTSSSASKNQGCLFISGGSTGSTGYLNYWFLEGAKMTKKCGKMSSNITSSMKKKEIQSYCCGANIQDQVIVGTSAGVMLLFNADMEATGLVEAHSGPILSIAVAERTSETWFVTGGKDGKIRLWSPSCQPLGEYNVISACVFDVAIGSLDILTSATGAKLLVGSHGGDIIQLLAPLANDRGKGIDIAGIKAEVMVRGHAKGELWGIAPHPLDPNILASVGDDGTIRIWSIRLNKMLGFFLLPTNHRARSCTWHPIGNILVVSSYFISKKKEASSNIHLYDVIISADAVNFQLRYEGRVSSSWISDMRFTPEGMTLAVCCHDRKIYFYKASPSAGDGEGQQSIWKESSLKKAQHVFQKHSSAVLHIDFSSDGNCWQSCCQAGDLLYGNVTSGIHETSATKFAPFNNAPGHEDEHPSTWSTHSSKLGWPVQGIWSSGMDLSDINAVDRNNTCTMLASATDAGEVRIFRYPVVNERSEYTVGKAHSSHVTNIRWTVDGCLVSAGGKDQCIIVWDLSEL
jgi:WD40 repeat protein